MHGFPGCAHDPLFVTDSLRKCLTFRNVNQYGRARPVLAAALALTGTDAVFDPGRLGPLALA
jgi:hypothetical protein